MGKNNGEPSQYDPHFNGPTHNRSCTDILWLILFILFLGVWGFVGYHSMQNGNIKKLLAPVDSRGRRCGLDAGLENKKYLVFFDIKECLTPATPITGCSTPQVCVEQCPTETLTFMEMNDEFEFQKHKSSMVCTDEVTKTSSMTLSAAKIYIRDKKCAGTVLKSQPALYRCIGDLSSLQCNGEPNTATRDTNCLRNPTEARTSLLNKATALDSYVGWFVASWMTFFTHAKNERDTQILSGEIVHDLVETRWFLLGALIVVIVICFVYILLLRWVVGPVVWISLVGLLALLGFCTYLCYKNYVYFRDNASLYQTTNLKGYVQSVLSKSETWMAFLVITAIILVALLLIVIFLRSRITIAIALIREGSKAVTAIKSTVFFPIIPWIIQCFVIAYGALVLMYLLSMGESVFKIILNNETNCPHTFKDGTTCDPKAFYAQVISSQISDPALCKKVVCHFTGLDGPMSVVWLHLANLLGFFWTMFFIGGLSDMMLASTFCTWYWTRSKSDLPFFTLTAGVVRTIRYHAGTVALGSLIIAIVRVIRVILEYIDQKLKKFDNPVTKAIMCCCKCLCWCLENFLKFINKNAYIMCAMRGYNFCKSAREAFSLLMRNIVRTVVLDKVTDFIFFLSKLLISIGVGFATNYLLQWKVLLDLFKMQPLHYSYIPAIILSIATYLVSTIYFKVYEMAVDTLFICFLEDCDRNDGKPEKPYFMSKNLMKILGKRNKKFE